MDLEIVNHNYQSLNEDSQDSPKSLAILGFKQFFGSLVFTYGVVACDNNALGIMLIFSLTLYLTDNNPFNPATTLIQIFRRQITVKQFWLTYACQFLGAFMGGLLAYFTISNWLNNVPYLESQLFHGLVGQLYGECLGSVLFFCVVLIQEDESLKFTSDPIEENLIIVCALQAFRQLAYTSYSLFNPALAISYEMFASIKDGEWQRLGFIWIFICGPFIGAFTALIIVPTFYRYFFDKKAKYTI